MLDVVAESNMATWPMPSKDARNPISGDIVADAANSVHAVLILLAPSDCASNWPAANAARDNVTSRAAESNRVDNDSES